MDLNVICDIIILIGAVAAAITSILKLIGKPIHLFKKRIETEKSKELEALTKKIAKSVEKELTPNLDEIKQQNLEQNEAIDTMLKTTKDLLRKSIMNIYEEHKHERRLTETEREMLDDLYRDYRAEHGNGYIEKIYNRMCKWDVVSDEE